MVKTQLPITGQPERPQRDVAEVVNRVREACANGGGTLERNESPWGFESTRLPVVARGIRVLANSGLTGQFWCNGPSGLAQFMIEVVPASEASSPPFSLGWNWNIAFQLVSPSALQQHAAHRVEYEKSVTDLRSQLKVGTQVQIQTSDLPDSLTDEWRKRHRDVVGNICGMVTEIKGPLAQVQIQGMQLAMEMRTLFPQASKSALSDVLSTKIRQPQTWCLK